MRLSIKPLKNFSNINSFDSAGTEWTIREQEASTLYFQIIDLDRDGLRYIPTNSSYSVSVMFPALDPTKVVTKVASQADALDRSIWSVAISSNDVVSTGNVQFSLTEASAVKKFSFLQGLQVEFLNQGGC